MKCPICESQLNFLPEKAVCANHHEFEKRNDTYQIVAGDYKTRLHKFLENFEDFRESEISKYTPEKLRNLPFTEDDPGMWSLRQEDLRLVQSHIQSNYKTALEFGAWNGWLTHHLAKSGLKTTAIDHFTHEIDGLGAKMHYKEDWRTIQMDHERLELLDEKFDLIIANRCLGYFENPEKILPALKAMLNPNGTIIFIGLTLKKDTRNARVALEQMNEQFQENYNESMFFKEYPGYLSLANLKALKADGMQIKIYPKLRLQTMLGRIIASRPMYFYGVYTS